MSLYSSKSSYFYARMTLAMTFLAIPAACLLPGYLAHLTIKAFADVYALKAMA